MSSGNTPSSYNATRNPESAMFTIQADWDVNDPPPSQGSMVRDQGMSYNESLSTNQIQNDGDDYYAPPSRGSMGYDQGQSFNNTFHDRGLGQTNVIDDNDIKAPSFTACIPENGNSITQDAHIDRGLGNSLGGQAPSVSAMTRANVSQNLWSSYVDHCGGEQGPNLSDVNQRGSSQNAMETQNEVPDAQKYYGGVSLVGDF